MNKIPSRILSYIGNCHLVAVAVFLCLTSGIIQTVVSQDSETGDTIQISGTTMGPIPFQVSIVTDAATPTEEVLSDSIAGSLSRINELMSTYQPDSDVSRFNVSETTDWFEVDSETAKVVARALEISQITDGAFDITVGPAVNLWHFGPAKEKKFVLPTDDAIDEIKKRVGWKRLSVRTNPPALKKTISELQIDLSAIAKGYAVDKVSLALEELGCTNTLVVVGGEVFARGTAASGRQWKVGIEKPQEGFGIQLEEVVKLENAAMATSGDYRNFNVVDGVKYSHTIDPTTCKPVTNDLATASVIAKDCMTADAFATAVMVMGAKEGLEFCDSNSALTYIMERQKSDPLSPVQYENTVSKGFPLSSGANKEPASEKGILPVFLAATVVFALAILGMAAGAILNNKQLQGSCGGLAAMEGEDCQVCEKPSEDCVENKAE